MNQEYRPCVTKYLVHWQGGKLGGFEDAGILMCAIAENRSAEPGKPIAIWKLTCTLPTIYEPVSEDEVRETAFPTQVVSEIAA